MCVWGVTGLGSAAKHAILHCVWLEFFMLLHFVHPNIVKVHQICVSQCFCMSCHAVCMVHYGPPCMVHQVHLFATPQLRWGLKECGEKSGNWHLPQVCKHAWLGLILFHHALCVTAKHLVMGILPVKKCIACWRVKLCQFPCAMGKSMHLDVSNQKHTQTQTHTHILNFTITNIVLC